MAEATAFRNNALPYPVYGLPYVVVFPLLDADGDPVTGATCDSEVSLNGDTGSDCTNEGVEITFTTATNKGMYYLILTAAEMTADVVTVTIYSATSKATPIVLYPRKLPQVHAGTATAGAASTITLQNTARALDDYYIGALLYIHTGTGSGQTRIISDYTTSYVATVSPAWTTQPDNTSQYYVYLTDMAVNALLANVMGWIGTPCATPTVAGVPEVDLTHMAGVVQSVTDLKDFVDTGYDPTAHKVQGVVLTDTCTSNTDMRGTDSAALASVCTETRLSELDAANLPTDIAAIPTATEIQTEMEENGASILDTLRDDLADGGRLDLLIDAIKAKTDNLPADPADDSDIDTQLAAIAGDVTSILSDTAEIGAAGAGLTALGDTRLAELAAGNIPADIDTLLTRLSATRAGFLDELDSATASKLAWYMAKMFIALVNKASYKEVANGNPAGTVEQFNDSDVSIGTISAAFTSDGTYTTRKRLVI